MKKANDKSTFTIARDNGFSKRLELLKEKGLLVEKLIGDCELGKDCSQFILDCFKKSLMLFPTATAKADSPEELREWPRLSSLKEADQPMTQEEMEELWQSIEKYIETYDIDDSEYTFIDFEKGTLAAVGSAESILDATIEMEIISTGISAWNGGYECFDLRANNHLKGSVYLVDQWHEDQPMQGLLRVVDEDGKNFFVGLKYFSMMARTLTCNASDGHTPVASQSQAEDDKVAATAKDTRGEAVSASKECTETMEPDVFILFNKPQHAYWKTRF